MTALDRLARPYKIESDTWGQSIEFSDGGNEMLTIVACDFDCGQTTTIGIRLSQVDTIVEVLRAIQADAPVRKAALEAADDEAKDRIKELAREKSRERRERDGK